MRIGSSLGFLRPLVQDERWKHGEGMAKVNVGQVLLEHSTRNIESAVAKFRISNRQWG